MEDDMEWSDQSDSKEDRSKQAVSNFQNQRQEARLNAWDLSLQQEMGGLMSKRNQAAQRSASHFSEQLITEVKMLLDSLQIPYINAPSEAEAQCCELERLRLVDAIISDDCDCFLFGGQTVYRNVFKESKNVTKYSAGDLERNLGLHRNHLIGLACLLGSDYTEGIKHVGPVNASEIVQAFCGGKPPSEAFEGLRDFRKWLFTKNTKDVRPSNEVSLEEDAAKYQEYKLKSFKWKHRGLKKKIYTGKTFPSQEVIDAYLKADVDSNSERFRWGRPVAENIKETARKIGWNDKVMSDLVDHIERLYSTNWLQTTLESQLLWREKNANIKSVRAKKALSSMAKEANLNNIDAI